MFTQTTVSARGLAKIFSMILFAVMAGVTTTAVQKKSRLSETASVTVKATIEAINKTDRTLMLKGPDGTVVMLEADDRFKRFDDLKVGDEITATYTESIAAHVRRPGEPAPESVKDMIAKRKKGIGATASLAETITVTIKEVDTKAPSVTVEGPEGRVIDFRVRDAKILKGLKPGDKVDVTFTRALLLKVDPQK